MKKNILSIALLLLYIAVSTLQAQIPISRVKEFQQQANQFYAKQEYQKALPLYQKAFAEFSAQNQYQDAIDCGLKAAEISIQQNAYKEAYGFFNDINQIIRIAATKTGKPQYANQYALAKERLLLNLKLKNQQQSAVQLERLTEAAKKMDDAALNNEVLYMKTAYEYTYGNNKAGSASLQQLISNYTQEKQYDEVITCFQNLISLSEQTNSAKLTAQMYEGYMIWSDSINAIKARQEINALQNQYDEAVQLMTDKDDKLTYRMLIITGTGILLCIITILLILLFINQLRLKASNHNYKKKIKIANEFSELKTQFIHNISSQIEPSLNQYYTIAEGLPLSMAADKQKLIDETAALRSFTQHIDEVSTLETTINVPYEMETINVKDFCEGIVAKITPQLKAGVALSGEAPKLQVKGNKEQMERLLLHLLHNAAFYTTEGSIRLEFKKRGAHTYQFVVTDTGPGIPEEKREDLFKPFKRVDDLTQGDGLGLPICNLIATKLNGSLTLDSGYRKGCRFIVELHS